MNIDGFYKKPVPAPEGYYETFQKTLEHEYCCPKCETDPFEQEYGDIDEKWPKCYNSWNHQSDMGHFYGWDEFHKCHECGTKFWFENGN